MRAACSAVACGSCAAEFQKVASISEPARKKHLPFAGRMALSGWKEMHQTKAPTKRANFTCPMSFLYVPSGYQKCSHFRFASSPSQFRFASSNKSVDPAINRLKGRFSPPIAMSSSKDRRGAPPKSPQLRAPVGPPQGHDQYPPQVTQVSTNPTNHSGVLRALAPDSTICPPTS